MKSLQETFDAVVKHARTQKEKAVTGSSYAGLDTCKYRLERDGKILKCFAGALIPDEDYTGEMEGKVATDYPVARILEKEGHNPNDVRELQKIHDYYAIGDWESEFKRFAEERGLTYVP